MTDTKLYRVRLTLDTGVPGECAAIEHNGALWLVPAWIPFPNAGYTTPERMIPLDLLGYKVLGDPKNLDLAIDGLVPNQLLSGPLPSNIRQRYGVLERPDIRFRTGATRH